jgi:hypothetical protein
MVSITEPTRTIRQQVAKALVDQLMASIGAVSKDI